MLSLPIVTLIWTSEDSIVAAGHDCQPFVFSGSDAGWQKTGTLDDTTAPKSAEPGRAGYGGSSSVGRLKTGAFATFRDADSRGHSSISGSGSSPADTKLLTVHQNTITSVRAHEVHGDRVTRVSTSGVDGKLVVWDADAVATGSVSALSARLGSAHLR
jgi:actin related protein 2/3 complex subunit 1A/1B